jgi:crotonobetainyl-CoA:carnitine CoA-transferase CaiB-like acyl-CoA transferase
MRKMLDSLRVLDLTTGHAMIAGQMLAKLGADVIQVEAPCDDATEHGDDRVRRAFTTGKRGITCNLESDAGRILLRGLIGTADVLIHTHSRRFMAEHALAWDELQQANPALVSVSITPFGEDGPKAGYAVTDLVLWAAGGALLPNRDGDRAPVRISSDQAMLHAGSDAAVGALVALAARKKMGRGQEVRVAAVESVALATLSSVLAAPLGHDHFTIVSSAPKKADGKKQLDLSGSGARTRRSKWIVKDGIIELHLAIGPAAGRFTNNLFGWLLSQDLCDPRYADWDWTTLPARIERGEITDGDLEAARAQVGEALARFTKVELLEVSLKHKLLIAPVMSIADLAHSAHLNARGAFSDVVDAHGKTHRVPGVVTGTISAGGALRPAPLRGQHNQEIFGEIGVTGARLKQLVEEGAI